MTDPVTPAAAAAELSPAPEPAAETAVPEPAYVVVPWSDVPEYSSKGYQVGYVMLKP
jgi:hypothetical protein